MPSTFYFSCFSFFKGTQAFREIWEKKLIAQGFPRLRVKTRVAQSGESENPEDPQSEGRGTRHRTWQELLGTALMEHTCIPHSRGKIRWTTWSTQRILSLPQTHTAQQNAVVSAKNIIFWPMIRKSVSMHDYNGRTHHLISYMICWLLLTCTKRSGNICSQKIFFSLPALRAFTIYSHALLEPLHELCPPVKIRHMQLSTISDSINNKGEKFTFPLRSYYLSAEAALDTLTWKYSVRRKQTA